MFLLGTRVPIKQYYTIGLYPQSQIHLYMIVYINFNLTMYLPLLFESTEGQSLRNEQRNTYTGIHVLNECVEKWIINVGTMKITYIWEYLPQNNSTLDVDAMFSCDTYTHIHIQVFTFYVKCFK